MPEAETTEPERRDEAQETAPAAEPDEAPYAPPSSSKPEDDATAPARSTSGEVQPIGSGPPPEDTIIELRDLHKSFGDLDVLNGASLSVERGTSAVVMGGSGAGKSVLLKHVVKLLTPDAGEPWVKGQRVDEMTGEELDDLRLSIGYLFQGGALFDSMSVEENMNFFLKRHSALSKGERQDRIEETLSWVNLVDTAPKYPAELSGGQQKRIGLARAIILQPEILLYDEPTTGLDPVSVRTVSDLIVRLRDERGITSVAITHDLLCAEIITDRAHFIYEGEILESGTLKELKHSDHPTIRNFFGN
ncbi:MAG: ABC transporter ATP-binding protein [Bacteroidetes bacterium SW_4_67_19]|jgi:phospholipid/cholesterol/gamma-HCH transport system ATP-binding protein|nr:MAG: ABC transporter ATP-binding protein [Bacteroidetes bacterium SW_4_67_19]